MDLTRIQHDLEEALNALDERFSLKGKLLVIGCSTSEVIGKQIGKAGSPEVADALFDVLMPFVGRTKLILPSKAVSISTGR